MYESNQAIFLRIVYNPIIVHPLFHSLKPARKRNASPNELASRPIALNQYFNGDKSDSQRTMPFSPYRERIFFPR